MKRKLILLAGALLLGSVAVQAERFEPRPQAPRYCKTDAAKSQVLFDNGKVNFEVVCGSTSISVQAANELAARLSEAFGVKIPVLRRKSGKMPALIVGDPAAAQKAGFDPKEMEWGGFRIKSFNGDIILAGRDVVSYSDGSYYAVLTFLERFAGMRFYFPGEIGTIVPKMKKWSVPAIDLCDRPDMQTRTMYSVDPFPTNFHGGGGIRWYDEKTKKDGSRNAQRYYRIQLRSPFQSCHGLAHIALKERFAKTHPEYFALNVYGTRESGKEKAAETSTRLGHVCFSSKGLKDELFLDAKAVLTGKDGSTRGAFRNGRPAWPNGDQVYGFFNIMPNDSSYYCQCPKCKPHFAGLSWTKNASQSSSDLTWRFKSDVAKRIKEAKIPGYLLTMAYGHYKIVPNVDIPDNLLVMLALSGPWAEFTPAKSEQMKMLKDWRKKLGSRPYIWNYATKFSAKIELIPNCTPRAFGRYYKEVGDDIFGAFLECETDYWIFGFMNYYMFGRMMWDKNADGDAILAEHYKLMCGPAAAEMTGFFDILENIWMHKIVGAVIDTPAGPASVRPSEYMLWNEIYSPALRAKLDNLLKKAAVKCEKEPLMRKRIAFMRKNFYDPICRAAELYKQHTAEVKEWKGVMPAIPEGTKMTIDGKADEAAWKAAKAFYLLPNSTVKSERVDVRTCFRALRDKENFYFFIECEEPETDKMTTKKRKFDEFEIWEDNTVELFLNPSGDRKTGYQLMFNSAGALADNRFILKALDFKWNSQAEYKVAVVPGKKWCLEVRLPRRNMEACSKQLIANVMRSRVVSEGRSPYQTWSPRVSEPHNMVSYGILEFDEPKLKSILPGGDFTEPVCDRRFLGRHNPPRWCSDRPLRKDTEIFRTGGCSIRMDHESQGFYYYKLDFLKPNTRYRMTFYVKTQDIKSLFQWGGGVYVALDFGIKPRKQVFCPKNNGKFIGTMPWTRQVFEFTTPKNLGESGRVYLSVNRISRYNDPKGIAWVDQFELFEVPENK